MNTETTDNNETVSGGEIFFDAQCRFCVGARERWGHVFECRGWRFIPMQTPGVAHRLGVTEEMLMAEMWVLPTGLGEHARGGLDAWIALMRTVWWLRMVAILVGIPGIRQVMHIGYRWLARNRRCIAGTCRIEHGGTRTEPQALKPTRHRTFFELP